MDAAAFTRVKITLRTTPRNNENSIACAAGVVYVVVLMAHDTKPPLRPPLAARFTREQEATIEAWRKHLEAAAPGCQFTSADAMRSLISMSPQMPEVKKALRGTS